ncbi:intermembrane transport protein PqiB [Neptuniibacter halophilus]|uniref:intermembrane transport protein PqiB n=1 Tax=Neptuniibacter halophilus TaxID=651666 RepID=UPI002573708D|nr:intermembrane transport protein PqiB [Neptuniibacter halophilus]
MAHSNPTDSHPLISSKRSFSAIWILPLVALLMGGWMVYHEWANRGQLITISFSTADGIEAGKTKLKVSSVEVGKVESVQLNYPHNDVIIKARVEPEAESLLKNNTRFWVVRPRIGTTGVSGLGTLLSGAYIEMSPGDASATASHFTGLEEPPLTSESEPGLRLQLVSDNAHSLSVGDTVLFRGFPVGGIEQVSFDPKAREAIYDLFIKAPFDQLVSSDSRFWNNSGINLSLSADGVNIQTGTLDTLLSGGVSFDVLDDKEQGRPAGNGDRFRLYPDFSSVRDQPFAFYNEYLLLFDQSVRGLVAGAPVEFRGVRIGSVERIFFTISEVASETDPRIPVVIRLEPGRLGYLDEKDTLPTAHETMNYWVEQGMRASLKSGNLLTGSLFIDFDLYPETDNQSMTEYDGYSVIPTVSGGFVQLENKLLAVLNKIEQLKVEPVLAQLDSTLGSSEQTIRQLNTTLKAVEKLVADKQTQALPEALHRTLQEIRLAATGVSPQSPLYHELGRTLESLQQTLSQLQPLLKTLDEKPNALIFDAPKSPDPLPGGMNNE